MRFVYDQEKDRENISKHRISLSRAKDFDFSTAVEIPDDSQDYGESRFVAVGFLAGTLYVMVFLLSDEETTRVVSLRRASKTERKDYAEH